MFADFHVNLENKPKRKTSSWPNRFVDPITLSITSRHKHKTWISNLCLPITSPSRLICFTHGPITNKNNLLDAFWAVEMAAECPIITAVITIVLSKAQFESQIRAIESKMRKRISIILSKTIRRQIKQPIRKMMMRGKQPIIFHNFNQTDQEWFSNFLV